MATVTKKSFSMDENNYLDAGSVHIYSKDKTLAEYADAAKVNNQAIPATLKSADFAEAVTGEKMLAALKYTGSSAIALDGKTWTLASLGITYEDVTITTGSTQFQNMYYGDSTPTYATRGKTVAMFVYNVGNSRPAYLQWTDNTTLRAYTTAASTEVLARVYYLTT